MTNPHNSMALAKRRLCLLGLTQGPAVVMPWGGDWWRDAVSSAGLIDTLNKLIEEMMRPTKTSVPCCGHRRRKEVDK